MASGLIGPRLARSASSRAGVADVPIVGLEHPLGQLLVRFLRQVDRDRLRRRRS